MRPVLRRASTLTIAASLATAVACGARTDLAINGTRGAGGATTSTTAATTSTTAATTSTATATTSTGGSAAMATSASTAASTSSTAASSTAASSTASSSAGGCGPAGPVPQVIAMDAEGVMGLALDATYAYWANNTTGTVQRVPKCGGAPTVLATGLDEPGGGIAVGPNAVYVSCPGGLFEIPLAGGPPSMVAPLGDYDPATGLALDATYVYWIQWVDLGDSFQILRRALAGGPITTVTDVPTPGGALPGNPLAVDDTYVYFSNRGANGPEILYAPKDGGTTNVFAVADHVPTGIAVDDTSVYWCSHYGTADGEVAKADKTGPGLPMVLVSGQQVTVDVTIDATNVYWVNLGGGLNGDVSTAPKTGGPITVLAGNQDGPNNIAVDATGVYWTNYTGTVVRVAP